MKNTFKLFGLALLLTGCDPEVSRDIGKTTTQSREVSCHKFGYCFTCMPSLNGKMKCTMKFSQFCPGKRNATLEVTPITITRESGYQSVYEQVKVINYTSSCQ